MKRTMLVVAFMFALPAARGATLCPDGKYHADGRCKLCPDGSYTTAPKCALRW